MDDLTDDQAARFDAARARLTTLKGHVTVQSLVAQLAARTIGLVPFFAQLVEIPEVHAALGVLGGVVVTGVSGVAASASGPAGFLAGPAAGAVMSFALSAIDHKFQALAASSPPT